MPASEFGLPDEGALADVTNKGGGYGPAKAPTPHPHAAPSPYGAAPSKEAKDLPKGPQPPLADQPKPVPVQMDVDEKDFAKLLVQMNENFSQMNNRFNDLPTKTDLDSYMGKVNKLEGTLNNHIEAAKVESASIHAEFKTLQDRVTTIEGNKGLTVAPRRPADQAASRFNPDPTDVAKCEKEIKLVFSGIFEKNQTLATVTHSLQQINATLESLGADIADWIPRKKRNETDVILKFKDKSLTKAAKFAMSKRNEDGSYTDMMHYPPHSGTPIKAYWTTPLHKLARNEPLYDALAILMERHGLPKEAFNCDTKRSRTISMRSTGKTLARQKLGGNWEVDFYDD